MRNRRERLCELINAQAALIDRRLASTGKSGLLMEPDQTGRWPLDSLVSPYRDLPDDEYFNSAIKALQVFA